MRPSGPVESPHAEQGEVVVGLSEHSQIRHDFAHHAGELEAMPREPRRHRHLRVVGCWSIMKCPSGELVNMHALSDMTGPAADGK